jgi:hypothetical protein
MFAMVIRKVHPKLIVLLLKALRRINLSVKQSSSSLIVYSSPTFACSLYRHEDSSVGFSSTVVCPSERSRCIGNRKAGKSSVCDRKVGKSECWNVGKPESRKVAGLRPESLKVGKSESRRSATGKSESRKAGKSPVCDRKVGKSECRNVGKSKSRLHLGYNWLHFGYILCACMFVCACMRDCDCVRVVFACMFVIVCVRDCVHDCVRVCACLCARACVIVIACVHVCVRACLCLCACL